MSTIIGSQKLVDNDTSILTHISASSVTEYTKYHKGNQLQPDHSVTVVSKQYAGMGGVEALRNSHQLLVESRTSLISKHGGQSHTSDSQWNNFNRQQVLKVVSDWFEDWQPTQQKLMLSGIISRCSTNQLETLATTLEPIFHQDFKALRHRKYHPRAVNNSSDHLTQKGKNSHAHVSNKRSSIVSDKVSSTSAKSQNSRISDVRSTCTKSHSLVPIHEELQPASEKPPAYSDNHRDVLRDVINTFADQMSHTITSGVLEYFQPPPETVEECAEIITGKAVNEALALVQRDQITQAEATTGNEVPMRGIAMTHGEGKLSPTTRQQENKASDEQENQENCLPSKKRRASRPLLRGKRSSFSKLTHTNRKEDIINAYLFAGSKTYTLKDVIQNELRSSGVFGRQVSMDCIDLHLSDKTSSRRLAAEHHNALQNHCVLRPLSRTSTVRTSSGQRNSSLSHEGLAEPVILRSGQVNKPTKLSELHARDSHVRPSFFEYQLQQIWQWLSEWGGHEKLSLLTEVIKLCGSGLIKYLTHCLSDRLKERLDISWLPDRLLLLIFSYLDMDDLHNVTRVCKRWRHAVAMDELWMIKCLEFGQFAGIPDIIQRVTGASHGDLSIDWRTAYLELQRITRDAKSALSKPNPITVPEPCLSNSEEQVPSIKAELPLKRGTAAQLARESSRLKRGHMTSEEEDDWWSQRETQSERGHPRALGRTASPESEVFSLPRLDSLVPGNARLSRSLDGQLDTTPGLSPRSKGRTRLLLKRPQHSRPSTQKHVSLANVPSEETSTTVDGELVGAGSKGAETAENKAILQWIRGKKKPENQEGEMALDVRPDLVQATDILGKSHAGHQLRWKDSFRANKKYAGQVRAVRRVRKFHGHMDAVLCVEFGTRRLFSGSLDRSIRVWDVRSGRSIHKMYGHKGAITCLKFDKNTLYSGSWDMVIMVWDLITFERRQVLTGHRGTVSCLALSKHYLLSGSHDATVRVWNRLTLHCDRILRVHESHIVGMLFNGEQVVTASSDRTVCITNIQNGVTRKVVRNHPENIHSLLVEGSLLLTGTHNGRVYFWNMTSGESEAGIQASSPEHPVNSLAFHCGRFFTASGDQTVKEWDLLTMTCVRSLQGHKAPVRDFKVSDKRMVSCSNDGQIRVWDLELPEDKLAEVSDDQIPYEVINQRDLKGL